MTPEQLAKVTKAQVEVLHAEWSKAMVMQDKMAQEGDGDEEYWELRQLDLREDLIDAVEALDLNYSEWDPRGPRVENEEE